MNDKIKQLLENAEQSDAIAKNKWRIENREQLRKERKEKLKELMEKDKQQTVVEWFAQQLYETLEIKGDGYVIDSLLDLAIDKENIAKQEAYNQGFAKAKSIYLDGE